MYMYNIVIVTIVFGHCSWGQEGGSRGRGRLQPSLCECWGKGLWWADSQTVSLFPVLMYASIALCLPIPFFLPISPQWGGFGRGKSMGDFGAPLLVDSDGTITACVLKCILLIQCCYEKFVNNSQCSQLLTELGFVSYMLCAQPRWDVRLQEWWIAEQKSRLFLLRMNYGTKKWLVTVRVGLVVE